MNKLFVYTVMAIAGATAFSSCSSDDPDNIGSQLQEKTYNQDALVLTLNGTQIEGKTVTFTPGNDGTATITLAGQPIDLSVIMGGIMGGTKSEAMPDPGINVQSAGVLPGSPSVNIKVKLEGAAESYKFKGDDSTDFCTFSYEGSVSADSFYFNLTDVKLKNTSLAGTWTFPDPIKDEYWGDYYYNNSARVIWQAEKVFNLGFLPLTASQLIQFACGMPLVDVGGSAGVMPAFNALNYVLKSVTFGEDGSITAKYVDTTSPAHPVVDAPAGLAQYVIEGDGSLRVYLNVQAIMANAAASKTKAADVSVLVNQIFAKVVPMLSQGIPLKYGPGMEIDEMGEEKVDDSVTSFYLDTETLLPLLKIFVPLLEDEDFVKVLQNTVANTPGMSDYADMIGLILNDLPGVINTTSKIELGLNLRKE